MKKRKTTRNKGKHESHNTLELSMFRRLLNRFPERKDQRKQEKISLPFRLERQEDNLFLEVSVSNMTGKMGYTFE